MYRVADAHTHIYALKIAEAATSGIFNFYGFPYHEVPRAGTPEHLYEVSRRDHISRCLVSQVAMKPGIVDVINTFLMEQYHLHPEFYVPFAAIHPDSENPDKLIESFKEQGFFGVKLHPDYQKFQMDDPKMDRIYDACAEVGLPILFHCGDKRYDFSNPDRLIRVMKKHPKLKVQGAHFGGFSVWEDALRLIDASENIVFDISSSLPYMNLELVPRFFEKFGVHRFFFGSDYPLMTSSHAVADFLALGLPEETNQAVLYDNFAAYYGLRDEK